MTIGMEVTYTPLERLEFALRRESARLAYLESLGWKDRFKESSKLIDKLQFQLNELYSGS